MNDEVEEDMARLRAAALTKYDSIVLYIVIAMLRQ